MELNKIHNEDCLTGLKKIPDQSINSCITSPPYYGLRNYETPNQVGLENTPEAYIQKLVIIFHEVKRILKDDGTLWLNMGDTYAAYWGDKYGKPNSFGRDRNKNNFKGTPPARKSYDFSKSKRNVKRYGGGNMPATGGIKPKDLFGIPWMLAFALRADGWYLRQDIIWYKPNPMPESVKDRCTKSHEYIFLLSKSQRYYFDQESIKINSKRNGEIGTLGFLRGVDISVNDPNYRSIGQQGRQIITREKSNKKSVWIISIKPFKEAHFATFPQELIVDCIKAGCPESGIVLDPFMGAGTTAIVAKKLNRNYIGFELNPEYIKIAESRLYKELGMFK